MRVLFRSLALVAATVSLASAQAGRRPPTPPTPPAPPVRPARPVEPVRPLIDLHLDELRLTDRLHDLNMQRVLADMDLRMQSVDLARELDLARSIDLSEISMRAEEAALRAQEVALQMPQAPVQWNIDSDVIRGTLGGVRGGRPWADDGPCSAAANHPSDSLFNRARDLLNSSDYRVASLRFRELQEKYPNAQCIADAMYWQAFALYRVGGDAELRQAQTILVSHREKFPNARRTGGASNDVTGLLQQVRGALARRGDAAARQALAQTASSNGQVCDSEEQMVQAAALSALSRSDPEQTMTILQRVLAKRDECSVALRRNAVLILGRRGDDRAITVLSETARNDPSTQIRSDALGYLARFPSDAVLTTLEAMARTETNEQVRRAAARNLVGYPSPRARTTLRALIEDNSQPDNLRTDILSRFNRETGTAEDVAWLQSAYTSATTTRIKSSIIMAVARIGGPEAERWLMSIASSETEPTSLAAEAFRRSSASMTVAQLIQAYDGSGSRPMRLRIVEALARKDEAAATDKLLDIVRRGTDPEVRRQVIAHLADSKDPKVTAALLELIGR